MTRDREIPALHALPTDVQAVVLAYYEAGIDHGYQLGYQAAERDEHARWAELAAHVREARRQGPLDQRYDRHGEHERAERLRRLRHERGIDK